MSPFAIPDLAIDLGTAFTRVAGIHRGISQAPTNSAEDTPALRRGVICSLHAAVALLRPIIRKRRRSPLGRLRVLACAPTDVSPLERNLVRSCILEAGATSVIVVPEPIAAAVGAGIDIGSPYSRLLVDFGDGVTDAAVISEGKITHSAAIRLGRSDLRYAVQRFLTLDTGLHIAADEAERLLREFGLASTAPATIPVSGFRLGRPALSAIRLPDLHAVLRSHVDRMLAPLRTLLTEIPPEAGTQIIEDGIFLTGGGARLPGLCAAVKAETAIDTRLVPDPIGSVICGARRMLPFAASLDLWSAWGSYQHILSKTPPLVES